MVLKADILERYHIIIHFFKNNIHTLRRLLLLFLHLLFICFFCKVVIVFSKEF